MPSPFRVSLLPVLLLAATAAGLTVVTPAQSARDRNVKAYEKARKLELIEMGQRHVDIGWSMRKSGLNQQVIYQFVRAKELSEGEHLMAGRMIGIVRAYGDAFWRKARKKATRKALVYYTKRAADAEERDQRAHAKLARLAERAHMDDTARHHWRRALELGAELEITSRGAKIGRQKVGEAHVEWLTAQTIEVDGERKFDYASVMATGGGAPPGPNGTPRAPQFRPLPKLLGFREASTDAVVLRTDLPKARAEELCALGTALCEPLAERLEGLPVGKLHVLVFGKRSDYDAYLQARGHGDATVARGLCDYGGRQAMLCAEGLEAADLHALLLHELTHLYFWCCSPVRMPDFYAEGLAETFGGQGTFVWDGKALTVGGPMRRDRVDAVKKAPLPLRDLVAANALQLLGSDHDKAMVFYTQAQLLQRFLATPDCPWRARFGWWEDECRGALRGTESTLRQGSVAPAEQSFQRLFGEDLGDLEKAFFAWLAEQ